jgi:hypothetical protein
MLPITKTTSMTRPSGYPKQSCKRGNKCNTIRQMLATTLQIKELNLIKVLQVWDQPRQLESPAIITS